MLSEYTRMFVIKLLNKYILIKIIESIPIPYHDIIFNCIRLQFEVIEEDKFRHAPCTIYGTISVLP